MRCEELLTEEFGESCNYDVDDAVDKLEKLGIVSRVREDHHHFSSALPFRAAGYIADRLVTTMTLALSNTGFFVEILLRGTEEGERDNRDYN